MPLKKPKKPELAGKKFASAALLFETAAVSTKIRNSHKLGGERVKVCVRALCVRVFVLCACVCVACVRER